MSQLKIRPAVPADAQAIAHVEISNYRSAYAGLLPDSYLAQFQLEEEAADWHRLLTGDRPDRLLVVDIDGAIVGYTLGRPSSDIAGYDGEVVALHILRERQRQGYGTAMFAAMTRELQGLGAQSLMLWTLERNPMRRWYEQLGGTLIGRKSYDIDGAEIVEVAYGWPDSGLLLARLLGD